MNFSKGSMLDVAISVLEAKEGVDGVKFADIWEQVKTICEIGPEEEAERIGHLYTDLTFSGKVVALPDNYWGLRSRYTYDKVHIDVSEAYTDANTSDDDDVDRKENAEYDASVQGTTVSNLDSDEDGAIDDDDSEESSRNRERNEAADALGKDII